MTVMTSRRADPEPGASPVSSRRPQSPRGGAGTSAGAAIVHRAGNALATATVVAAVLAFLFLAVGPRALHYQTSTMLTGSMAPLINPGDVVVTVPTPVNDIRVGDVITYHIPVEDHRVETHRVTEVLRNPDGTTAVRTKGDANAGEDPWTATMESDTVHKHVFTVPYLGQAIRSLREPIILNLLMYGAPAILVGGLLVSIWRPNLKEQAGR